MNEEANTIPKHVRTFQMFVMKKSPDISETYRWFSCTFVKVFYTV